MTDIEIEEMRAELKKSIVDKAKCMVNAYAEIVPIVKDNIAGSGLKISDEELLSRTDMFFHMATQKTFEEKKELQREEEKKKQNEKNVMMQQRHATQNPYNSAGNFPQGKPLTMEEIEKLQKQAGPSGKSPCQERAERDKKIIEEKNIEIAKLSEDKK